MKRLQALMAGMVILCALLPCAAAWAGEPVKVRIQGPPAAGMLPLIWLQESGLLAGQAELEITFSQDHQRGLALAAASDLDLLVTGVNVGAKAYNKGIDLKLLSTNTWGLDYLLTAGFQAENWRDLEGKSLCLPLQGGPLDFLARYFLLQHGADLGRVEFVYLPSNSGAKTFQLGRFDAIILPEPLATVTLRSFEQAVLSLDLQEEWGRLHGGDERIPFVGLFARGGFARENQELVRLIREYYQAGAAWMEAHPEEAASLAERHFGQPAEVFQESLKRTHVQVYPRAEERELIEVFFSAIMDLFPEMIGGTLPDDGFYY